MSQDLCLEMACARRTHLVAVSVDVVENVFVLWGSVLVVHCVVVVLLTTLALAGMIVDVGVTTRVTVLVRYLVVELVVLPPEP